VSIYSLGFNNNNNNNNNNNKQNVSLHETQNNNISLRILSNQLLKRVK